MSVNTRAFVLNRFSCIQLFATLWTLWSPPGSSVHGILQPRILEWVAMPSSRGSSRHRDPTCISCVSCIGRWSLHRSAAGEVHEHSTHSRHFCFRPSVIFRVNENRKTLILFYLPLFHIQCFSFLCVNPSF